LTGSGLDDPSESGLFGGRSKGILSRRELLMGIGWQQILIVAVIALLLFGSARLPTLMRDMGRSLNEFKRGMKDSNRLDDDSEESR
jgi:sec-independent protein translocase protein TatA